MDHQPRVVRATLVADDVFHLLDLHKQEFAGTDWMPANFFQRKRIIYLVQRLEDLYTTFEGVDFSGLPGHAQLEKARYLMWVNLRQARRWQVKDHMKFLDHLNRVMIQARSILERLRRLALTGQIVRTRKPIDIQPEYTRLD